jgi:uncharacterized membrane protein YfcA
MNDLFATTDIKFILAGILVGSLVGFTGMGGGAVMTPLLIFMGLPAAKAIGSDLVYSAITKTVGSYRHAQRKRVDWQIAKWLAIGSVPASILGVFTVTQIKDAMGKDANKTLQQILGVMLIVVGCTIVWRIARGRLRTDRVVSEAFEWTTKRKLSTVGVGALGGFGVGLTSIGSGTLFAIFLMTSFPIVAQRVVGTDIFHATLVVWAAAAGHVVAGNVEFNNVFYLLIGSLPAVWISSQWTGKLPERPLRLALAGVLVLSGALMQ